MIEIKTTCCNEKEAKEISKLLLTKKLIACSNYFECKSMYLWKGKIENENEVMMILKTNNKNKDKVIEEIKKNHSYELPTITVSNLESEKETRNWINEMVR